MGLILIPPVSKWGGEIRTTLKTAPLIGPPPLSDRHLNPQPDLPLMPNSASDCLIKDPNEKFLPSHLHHFFDANSVLV